MPKLSVVRLPHIVKLQPPFSKPVWLPARTLLVGAILVMGKCTDFIQLGRDRKQSGDFVVNTSKVNR